MWPCINIAGTSDSVGSGCPATQPKDQLTTRAGDISKINVYFDGDCVTGIKPTYGLKSTYAQLLGYQNGQEKDLKLRDQDHIKTVEIRTNKGGRRPGCIEFIRFTTFSGAQLTVGTYISTGAQTLSGPREGSFVYAIKGTQGSGIVCSLQIVWARQDCGPAAVPRPVDVPVPVPTPVPVPVPVPKPVSVLDSFASQP
eukprot:gene7129-7343_t